MLNIRKSSIICCRCCNFHASFSTITRKNSRLFITIIKSRFQSLIAPILSAFPKNKFSKEPKLNAEEQKRREEFLAEFLKVYDDFNNGHRYDKTMDRSTLTEHRQHMIEDYNMQNAYKGLKIVRRKGIVQRLLDPDNAGRDLSIMFLFFLIMFVLVNSIEREITPEYMHQEIMHSPKITFEQLLKEYLPAKAVRDIAYYPAKDLAVILVAPNVFLNGKEVKSTYIKFDEEFKGNYDLIMRRIRKAEAEAETRHRDAVHISIREVPERLYYSALTIYCICLAFIVFMVLLKRNFHVEALAAEELPRPIKMKKGAAKSPTSEEMMKKMNNS